MNAKKLVLTSSTILVIGFFAIYNLKSEEIILSAKYQKLSCEKCYHMTIEKSHDSNLIGEMIIPLSSKVDIEKIIDSVAINNAALCLRGKLYLFNLNIFKIDPDGKRFDVISQEDARICASM